MASALVATGASAAEHAGPVPAPTDGFGAPGPYGVETRSFASPGFAGRDVTVFVPMAASGARPTWFFSHGYGGNRVEFYREFLRHLASHGWTTVFSPYPTEGDIAGLYDILFSGFAEAAERYPDAIDIRRVGFAGHSFGGGAAPGLLLRAYRELGWGDEARCLLTLAPWYSFELTTGDLINYPTGTQAIVQVYEDDVLNDHRMAIDLFRRLGLPAADKDYLLMRSDEIDGYGYEAGHAVPGAQSAVDALDSHGLFRLAAALSASCFEGSATGRAVALGNGSAEQCAMGESPAGRKLRPLVAGDEPVPLFPQSRYAFPFNSIANPRVLVPPPEAPGVAAHLVNLSVRAYSGTGDRVLIAGAVVEGARPKSLLVRAAGPALAAYSVDGAMADPQLAVFRGAAFDVGNEAWSEAFNVEALRLATAETGAFAFADGSEDAAVNLSFDPGTMTAQAIPATDGPGVALLEVYDGDLDASTRLVNLSARAYVPSGDNVLVAGFVVRGNGTVQLLIRAVGPTLADFDVSDALPDPRLTVHLEGGAIFASNDDWQQQEDAASIASTAMAVGAFALPDRSRDACLLVTLPAGVYTAQASDTDGRTGNVLIEAYAVP